MKHATGMRPAIPAPATTDAVVIAVDAPSESAWVALVTVDTAVNSPTAAHERREFAPRARVTTAATVNTRMDRPTTSGTADLSTGGAPAHPAAEMSPLKDTANDARATSTARISAQSAISGNSGPRHHMVYHFSEFSP